MTRVRWTTEAADQVETIVGHIKQENPKSARAVAKATWVGYPNLKDFRL